MLRHITILLCVLLLGISTVHGQDEDMQRYTLIHDDLERTYYVYIPSDYDAAEKLPVVFALHGRTGNGKRLAEYSELNTVAAENGFIAVYPDGVNGEWNFVRGIPGYMVMHDDVDFLITVLDEVEKQYSVDNNRVYILGISNGGFMAQRVACEDPSRFAAFASIAAAGFGGMRYVCDEPHTETAPILLMHGTADDNIPWGGIPTVYDGVTVYITYPVPETLAYWAEFNGCITEADTSELPQLGNSPGTSVSVVDVQCPEGTDVMLYAIIGGGHNWPGRPDALPASIAGRVNTDIEAGAAIWNFFKRFHREQVSP